MPIAALRRLQIGKESVLGTSVAAAAKLMGVMGQMNVGDRDIFHPEDERGSLVGAHRAYVPSIHWRGSKISGDVTYEDFPMIVAMAVANDILTPSTVDTNARKYLTSPNLTSANTPKSATLEFGDDVQEYEAEAVLCSALEISGAIDQAVKFSADVFGRQLTPSTFTGALSERSVVSVQSELMKLFMDDAGGTIGTTQKSTTLLEWRWRLPEHFVEKRHQDGALYYTTYGEMKMKPTLEVTAEFNSTLAALRAKYASATAGNAGTAQLVRLKGTDAGVIGAATATREFVIDGCYRIMDFKELGERNGASTVQMMLEAELADTSYAKLFEIYCQNAVTAMPW